MKNYDDLYKPLEYTKDDNVFAIGILKCPFCDCEQSTRDELKEVSIYNSLCYIPIKFDCGTLADLSISQRDTTKLYLCVSLSCQDKCESPIEEMFWIATERGHQLGLVQQHEIGNYRVDFANIDKKIVVELDGHDYHKTKEQRTNDAKRERELKLLGWDVVRFTGTEIYKDVKGCIKQLADIIYKDEIDDLVKNND